MPDQILTEAPAMGAVDASYVKALEEKWARLLEGSDLSGYNRGVLAVLMENQSRALQTLDEDTRTVNVGAFTKFVFPVLRRVFPNLIAPEIVSVQPMTAPIGAVFFLDYIYSDTKGATAAGSVFPRDFDRNYSGELVSGEVLAVGDGTNYGGAGASLGATLAYTPVRPLDTTKGTSVVIREVDSTGAVVQSAVDDGAGGFTGDATAGSLNYSNGALTGFLFTAAPAAGNKIEVVYFYDGELNTKIPSVGLDIKKKLVEAKPRRLKAVWSSEASEDLRALHGVDAEAEITSAIAQEISLEIDREIIDDVFQNATSTTGTFDKVAPSGIAELDHLRSLITVLSTVSNLIHRKTLRAPANWIVTSPEVSALLAQLTTHGDFRPLWADKGAASSEDSPVSMILPGGAPHGQFGIYKTGTLMNKWVVYEDPFFQRDKILLGLKGGSYLEAGYAWAPYIPLQVTPTFHDPNDMGFRKGLRSRYATQLLKQDYYGTVTVLNL